MIIINYHKNRVKLAKIQYDYLKEIGQDNVHYLCDDCDPPLDKPHTIFKKNEYQLFNKNAMFESITKKLIEEKFKGIITFIDCDRIPHRAYFMTPVYHSLSFTSMIFEEFKCTEKTNSKLLTNTIDTCDFTWNGILNRKVTEYSKINNKKVPTSGCFSLPHIYFDVFLSSLDTSYYGYGYNDIDLYLMLKEKVNFVDKYLPEIHLSHKIENIALFWNSNVYNARKLCIKMNWPLDIPDHDWFRRALQTMEKQINRPVTTYRDIIEAAQINESQAYSRSFHP